MSLKLVIICATVALVSSARFDQEELSRQMQQQQDIVTEQNDRIRDHRRLENQQRQVQLQDLEEQQRRQEQMIRDHEQQRRERVQANGNLILTAQPQLISSHPQIVSGPVHFISIPSSQRSFEVRDDSNYKFAYAVSDLTTGDIKSQQEARRGDQVQGSYTMMDSDGYQRTVEYRADDQNGFDAEVRREPTAAVLTPQVVRYDAVNSYANFYHHPQPVAIFTANHQPTIYSSTSVSRRDDGQRNEYTSSLASNF